MFARVNVKPNYLQMMVSSMFFSGRGLEDRLPRSVQSRALELFQPVLPNSVRRHHQTVLKVIDPEAAACSAEKHVLRRPQVWTPEDDATILDFVARVGALCEDNWLVQIYVCESNSHFTLKIFIQYSVILYHSISTRYQFVIQVV